MLDFLAPFETWEVEHPDFNDRDAAQETLRQQQRSDAISGFLFGETSADFLLDMAQEHMGIGADAYVEMVEDNINYIIDGYCYVEAPSGLLLPR